ncbi:MAG: L-aspartate oxidase [Deltaproteobacteria bacterium]|nr:L-aspartate oxidase [Deltaproteobacteria bacterium]
MDIKADFLILGSGIAGLTYALKVSRYGSVAIVTKKDKRESNTNYAQGGIAAVVDPEDTPELHIADTLTAGAGLCRPDIVDIVVREGMQRIQDLVEWGVPFSRRAKGKNAEFDLGREGGHSRRRILHAADLTGREIERVLLKKIARCPHITMYENHIAVELITSKKLDNHADGPNQCLGAYVLDCKKQQIHTFIAPVTMLATGGAGKTYLYTSNPDISTGDGIALAYRAGACVANLEFIQFHPTCMYHAQAKNFLISEALRGEGGILRLKSGKAFMAGYHPLKDLAPRDIVARAIDAELKRSGDDCVYLDITQRRSDFLKKRFPNIYATCAQYGIDIAVDPIPVVPAAHYICGGVLTDTSAQSTLAGLYAVGEVACTGLHGANRLASNSLLEAIVFAHRAALASGVRAASRARPNRAIPPWDSGNAHNIDEAVVIAHNWDEIRRLMWNYVGIVRTTRRLERARRRIHMLQKEITEYYWNFIITADLIELRNIATVAELIVTCALRRRESRGLHYTLDYPQSEKRFEKRDTILQIQPRSRGRNSGAQTGKQAEASGFSLFTTVRKEDI